MNLQSVAGQGLHLADVVSLALLVSGGIIVVGFLSNLLFERTGFPDMLLLIILGAVVGPGLGLFAGSSVIALAPYLAALALLFILFDGGIRMNIYQVVAESPRAAVLAVSGFALSLVAVAVFMIYVVNVPLLYAVLFGSIYGGSSSVAVVSLASKIKMSETASTVLKLESAITDILCIVVSLAVIDIILTGQMDYVDVAKVIVARFSTGAVIGIVVGFLWLSTLRRIVRAPYAYMLTLAMVLFSYAFSEYLGGSGALSSLVLGIVLGNEMEIYQMFKLKRHEYVVDEGLRRFESEIAFLIRSFFFVYLGLIATIGNVQIVIIGVGLSLLLLLVRFGAVSFITARSELRKERPIMSAMLTRGLAAAVLATLPLQYASVDPTFDQLSSTYINIALVIIVSTAIIATIGSFLHHIKKASKPNHHVIRLE
jgi:cell volume regulation protein A